MGHNYTNTGKLAIICGVVLRNGVNDKFLFISSPGSSQFPDIMLKTSSKLMREELKYTHNHVVRFLRGSEE